MTTGSTTKNWGWTSITELLTQLWYRDNVYIKHKLRVVQRREAIQAILTINLNLQAAIKKKRKYFVSSCPVLDVHSQGETKKKNIQNLIEALRLFFISCYERRTLDEVLKDCGFKPTSPTEGIIKMRSLYKENI